jgi:hypothetical protein
MTLKNEKIVKSLTWMNVIFKKVAEKGNADGINSWNPFLNAYKKS